jgi:hypothetical protein
VLASDLGGELPADVAALVDDRDATRRVELSFEFTDGSRAVYFTEAQARLLADQLVRHADLLVTPEPTWSYTPEQIEAYAAALLQFARVAVGS